MKRYEFTITKLIGKNSASKELKSASMEFHSASKEFKSASKEFHFASKEFKSASKEFHSASKELIYSEANLYETGENSSKSLFC